jgi:nucleoid-associated protein YgaU
VQRGLAYINTSELNLLGAILCKRLGRWEDMRHFVAAIPADDSLRGEGEWLLRSNQARQRPPAPAQRGKAPVAIPVIPDSDALPVVMDEVAPSAARRGAEPARRGLAPVAWLVVAALLLGGGWLAWQGDLLGGLDLPGAQVAGPPALQPAAVDGQAVQQESEAPEPGAESGASPNDPAAPAGGTAADGATAPAGAEEPVPSLLLPTPTIAPNLAQTDPTAQAIASASDDLAVSASNLTDLNWKAWLEGQNRADLAALPVTVRMDSRTLILEGTVEFAEQRAALEFQANQVSGVNDISVVNVVVRPPATYTVREGDSLWAISVRIYGNADLVEELYAANRNQLTSAGDLRVGMVLTVPPLE